MDKIKNFVYKNNINLYIFLKKYVQKKLNFPVDIDIFLLKNLEKNSVIVEAGAANGNDTVFFGENFPKSKIYSLEPMSSLYKVQPCVYINERKHERTEQVYLAKLEQNGINLAHVSQQTLNNETFTLHHNFPDFYQKTSPSARPIVFRF